MATGDDAASVNNTDVSEEELSAMSLEPDLDSALTLWVINRGVPTWNVWQKSFAAARNIFQEAGKPGGSKPADLTYPEWSSSMWNSICSGVHGPNWRRALGPS